MPRATVVVSTEKFDLKTLPEGYVVIRRMTFGEKLERQDEMMKMSTPTDMNNKTLEMSLMMKKMAIKDFATLVVEHNLTDENDRPLNFKDARDITNLDPRIGDEISALIDSINAFEETPETKNS